MEANTCSFWDRSCEEIPFSLAHYLHELHSVALAVVGQMIGFGVYNKYCFI